LKFNVRLPLGISLSEVEMLVREQAQEADLKLVEVAQPIVRRRTRRWCDHSWRRSDNTADRRHLP
jgi:hypothetical protein